MIGAAAGVPSQPAIQRAIQENMDRKLAQSLRDYTRAVGGGLVIGLPLLYTMEIWFQGFILPWWKLLLLLAIAFLIVLGYNSIAGFRRERTYLELILDSVSTIGLGIVVAFVALVVLGRIDASTSLRDAGGKVALEAIPIAFGASLAATQLSGDGGNDRSGGATGPFHRVLVGAGGALLFALNVAPTEEPVMLGIDAEPWLLLVVMGGTALLTLALVFYADFGGRPTARGEGLLDHPISETVTGYAVSLAVCLLLLWSFGRTDGASVQAIAGMTVMLAVVAAVGAAIGRLLVSGGSEAGAGSS
jgi:putative integral membrane protein (TIGR02587 family)